MSSLPTPKKPRKRTLEQRPQRQPKPRELVSYAQHREILESLGDDEGRLTWASSPHVLWLARQLEIGGKA